jgi:hypothetical protein
MNLTWIRKSSAATSFAALMVIALAELCTARPPAAPRGMMPGIETREANWLVAIGVDEAGVEEIEPLYGCSADATAICEALTSPMGCVNSAQTYLLADFAEFKSEGKNKPLRTNAAGHILPPTLDNIKKTLEEVGREARHPGMIIVYISTHGVLTNRAQPGSLSSGQQPDQPRSHYLLLPNANPETLEGCIAISDINKYLGESSRAIRVMIVDACKALDRLEALPDKNPASKRIVTAMTPEFKLALQQGSGAVLLTSCSPGEQSFMLTKRHRGANADSFAVPGSAYTHYFLEGLSHAIPDENERITIHGVDNYVRSRVSNWAAERGLSQTPWSTFRYEGPDTISLTNWSRHRERQQAREYIEQLIALPTRVSLQTAEEELREYASQFGVDSFHSGILPSVTRQKRRLDLEDEIAELLDGRRGVGVANGPAGAEGRRENVEEMIKLLGEFGPNPRSAEFTQKLAQLRERVKNSAIILGQILRRGRAIGLPTLEAPILGKLRGQRMGINFDSAAFMDEVSLRKVSEAGMNQDVRTLRELLDARCRFGIVVNAEVNHLGGRPNELTGIILQLYHIKLNVLMFDVATESLSTATFEGDSNIYAERATAATEARALDQFLTRDHSSIVDQIAQQFSAWLTRNR